MRWGILGPLRVTDDSGADIALPTGRVRVLLAALLVRANHAVSIDELSEVLWDGAPPSGAARTVQVYVVRLRRALGPSAGTRIVTRVPGYMYQCPAGADELDLLRFESLCHAGAVAVRAGDWMRADAVLSDALGLWRATPLADVPSESLRAQFVPRMEQLYLQAVEDRIEADLRLGRFERVVPHVRDLVAAHPLRERFHAQLIEALAAGGRRAEALAAYQQARRVIADELGIEPGPELRTLQERILGAEAEPIAPRGAAPREPAAAPAPAPAAQAVPRQLPAAVGHFTGRQAELDALTRLMDESETSGGTVVISAIDGMAGIGKTALAVHAAHRLAEKFPDGQLFLDLHGYTQGHPPRAANEALALLLRALGVPPERIPTDAEQAAGLYRQRLSDTRTLIVLDNAAGEAQVRPLLPGAGSCLVLVTSRRRLRGLDDAHTVALDLLSPPNAVALLRAVAGPGRIPADDPLAAEVAELCGYLPLALRIAASLLRHRPAWPLEHLAAQLRNQQQRVRTLSDGERELAAVFDLSYASLGAPHRRLWRRLGLVPGPDVDAHAAAALVESDPAAAAGLLEDLVDHNLLGAYAADRYRLHDLLRVQARTLAETDPAIEREAALNRLLHYYTDTAQSASTPLARYPRPAADTPADSAADAPADVPADAPVSAPTDHEAARTWLRTEQPNLDAAFTYAHTHGLDEHAIALAAGLAEILQADGPFARAFEIHRTAAETAERLARPTLQANALTDLGRVRYLTGDFPGADDALARALANYRAIGNELGEANALTELGRVRRLNGDYPGADDALTGALGIYHALSNRNGEANALTELGRVRYLSGDYPGADDALTRALEIYRALSHRLGEANALNNLGQVRCITDDYPGAVEAFTRALELYHAIGHRIGEAYALTEIGRVQYLTGEYPGAVDALTRALELYHAVGNRNGEANVLTELGRVRYQTGDCPGADDALTRALEIFRAIGNRYGEANALTELGRVSHQTGDFPAADEVFTQALAICRAIGNRYGEAYALTELGRVSHQTGDHPAADNALTSALEIFRAIGSRGGEAWALNYYAASLAVTGRRPRALALYEQALAMNRELNKPDDEAISLEGVAEHHLATGDPAQGAAYLDQALEIYERLGMTGDIHRVREQLDGITAR